MSKKMLQGKVVSDKMTKTVVVAVEIPKKHPIYLKAVKNTKNFKARNDMGAKMDDIVLIEECKPFSRTTTWLVKEIL